MTELGRFFGLTSHQIGRKLKEVGLRTGDGKPSRAAFRGGMWGRRWSRDHENYCWGLAQGEDLRDLRQAGLQTADDQAHLGVVTSGPVSGSAGTSVAPRKVAECPKE